jgi:hypothetical protein
MTNERPFELLLRAFNSSKKECERPKPAIEKVFWDQKEVKFIFQILYSSVTAEN